MRWNLAVTASAMLMTLFALHGRADAFENVHHCNADWKTDVPCLDGSGYHSWVQSVTDMNPNYIYPQVCNRAFTQAGNQKSGGSCQPNSDYAYRFYQPSPLSRTRAAYSHPWRNWIVSMDIYSNTNY